MTALHLVVLVFIVLALISLVGFYQSFMERGYENIKYVPECLRKWYSQKQVLKALETIQNKSSSKRDINRAREVLVIMKASVYKRQIFRLELPNLIPIPFQMDSTLGAYTVRNEFKDLVDDLVEEISKVSTGDKKAFRLLNLLYNFRSHCDIVSPAEYALLANTLLIDHYDTVLNIMNYSSADREVDNFFNSMYRLWH